MPEELDLREVKTESILAENFKPGMVIGLSLATAKPPVSVVVIEEVLENNLQAVIARAKRYRIHLPLKDNVAIYTPTIVSSVLDFSKETNYVRYMVENYFKLSSSNFQLGDRVTWSDRFSAIVLTDKTQYHSECCWIYFLEENRHKTDPDLKETLLLKSTCSKLGLEFNLKHIYVCQKKNLKLEKDYFKQANLQVGDKVEVLGIEGKVEALGEIVAFPEHSNYVIVLVDDIKVIPEFGAPIIPFVIKNYKLEKYPSERLYWIAKEFIKVREDIYFKLSSNMIQATEIEVGDVIKFRDVIKVLNVATVNEAVFDLRIIGIQDQKVISWKTLAEVPQVLKPYATEENCQYINGLYFHNDDVVELLERNNYFKISNEAYVYKLVYPDETLEVRKQGDLYLLFKIKDFEKHIEPVFHKPETVKKLMEYYKKRRGLPVSEEDLLNASTTNQDAQELPLYHTECPKCGNTYLNKYVSNCDCGNELAILHKVPDCEYCKSLVGGKSFVASVDFPDFDSMVFTPITVADIEPGMFIAFQPEQPEIVREVIKITNKTPDTVTYWFRKWNRNRTLPDTEVLGRLVVDDLIYAYKPQEYFKQASKFEKGDRVVNNALGEGTVLHHYPNNTVIVYWDKKPNRAYISKGFELATIEICKELNLPYDATRIDMIKSSGLGKVEQYFKQSAKFSKGEKVNTREKFFPDDTVIYDYFPDSTYLVIVYSPSGKMPATQQTSITKLGLDPKYYMTISENYLERVEDNYFKISTKPKYLYKFNVGDEIKSNSSPIIGIVKRRSTDIRGIWYFVEYRDRRGSTWIKEENAVGVEPNYFKTSQSLKDLGILFGKTLEDKYEIVEHPVHYYAREVFNPEDADAVYDLITDTWIKEENVPGIDLQTAYPKEYKAAERIAVKLDRMFGELLRLCKDEDGLEEFNEDEKLYKTSMPMWDKSERGHVHWRREGENYIGYDTLGAEWKITTKGESVVLEYTWQKENKQKSFQTVQGAMSFVEDQVDEYYKTHQNRFQRFQIRDVEYLTAPKLLKLYHMSQKDSKDSILLKGLLPSKYNYNWFTGNTRLHPIAGVFLASGKLMIDLVNGGSEKLLQDKDLRNNYVVFEVYIPKGTILYRDNECTHSAVVCPGPIPSKFIREVSKKEIDVTDSVEDIFNEQQKYLDEFGAVPAQRKVLPFEQDEKLYQASEKIYYKDLEAGDRFYFREGSDIVFEKREDGCYYLSKIDSKWFRISIPKDSKIYNIIEKEKEYFKLASDLQFKEIKWGDLKIGDEVFRRPDLDSAAKKGKNGRLYVWNRHENTWVESMSNPLPGSDDIFYILEFEEDYFKTSDYKDVNRFRKLKYNYIKAKDLQPGMIIASADTPEEIPVCPSFKVVKEITEIGDTSIRVKVVIHSKRSKEEIQTYNIFYNISDLLVAEESYFKASEFKKTTVGKVPVGVRFVLYSMAYTQIFRKKEDGTFEFIYTNNPYAPWKHYGVLKSHWAAFILDEELEYFKLSKANE